ncbi:hypothetical protein ACFVUS_16775 [Nocardia sp. NPDC058058]|uniref:hypothetical protein n=1 Tax=Nocardia sp. NPDC058058 TaxID=3346317 RepID=UPI0036DBAA33
MSERVPIGPVQRAETQQAIGRELVAAAPRDWNRLWYEFRATIQIDADMFESISAAGNATRLSAPLLIMELFAELRSATYQPGKGTWFTVRCSIDRSHAWTMDFDYEGEPAFNPQLTPDAFALDLEYFPRDTAHTPQWLSDMFEPDGIRSAPKS